MPICAVIYTVVLIVFLRSPFVTKLWDSWYDLPSWYVQRTSRVFWYIVAASIITGGFIVGGIFTVPLALGALIGYGLTKKPRPAKVKIRTTTIDDAFRDLKKRG